MTKSTDYSGDQRSRALLMQSWQTVLLVFHRHERLDESKERALSEKLDVFAMVKAAVFNRAACFLWALKKAEEQA